MSRFMPGGFIEGLVGEDGPPLVDVGGVFRRALIVAAVLSLLAIVVASVMGFPLVGLGVAIGAVLAGGNNRAFQKRTLRMIGESEGIQKRPFASSVFARLAVVTAVAFYLVYALPQVGWGVLGGLGAFQVALLGAAIGSLSKTRRSL